MSADPDLTALRHLFAWRDRAHHDARCAELERAHLVAVAQAINARLGGELRAELERLPDAAYLAILRGADTFFAARYGRSEDLERSLARWIVVERAVLGERAELDGTHRAAACDRHVEITRGRVVAIDALPRLPGTHITLDFTSELPSRLATRFPERTLVAPSGDERAVTTAKLAAAIGVLDEVSPLAGDFVRRMTDLICCRTAPGDTRFYTASDQTTLGVIHLVNTHLPRKSAAEVASELVHEAIHQAVFRAELAAPLFDDPELGLARVASPWTGASLDLHALTHACFVWYGVANLWRLSTAPASPAVARQRQVAEAGFARQPLVQLGALAGRLPPALGAVIDDMTREICAAA